MLLRNWLDGFLARFSSANWRRSHRRSGRVLKNRKTTLRSPEALEIRTLLSATTATFKLQTGGANPLNGVVGGPTFTVGDITGDGLPDVINGTLNGTFTYLKNTGTATNPAYTLQTGADNPLNGQDVGDYSAPALGDLNGDGLLDLIVGTYYGTFQYYQNTGTTTNPAFTLQAGPANPLNGQDIGAFSVPTLGDLNGDGLLDLMVGNSIGKFDYFLNTGSTSAPAFTLQNAAANPLNGVDIGSYSVPAFGDLNADGRLDLLAGSSDGTFVDYQNTGTTTNPVLTQVTGTANPLNGQDVGSFSAPVIKDLNGDGRPDVLSVDVNGNFLYYMNVGPLRPTLVRQYATANPLNTQDVGIAAKPAIGDLNGDGAPDLIVGNSAGGLSYYINTGTPANPTYALQSGAANPLDGQDVGSLSAPTLGDLTGDGLLDLIVGNHTGSFSYYKNTGTATTPAFTLQTGAANPLNGVDIGSKAAPALGDLNGDGLLDLITGEYYGKFTYFKNTGTATTPAFTVQNGAANPLNGYDVDKYATPTIGDLNGDGLLDVVSGNDGGNFYYFQNIGTATNPAFRDVRENWNPLNNQNAGSYSAPALGDLNGDGALDLLVGNSAGNFLYYKNEPLPVVPRLLPKTGTDNPLDGVDIGTAAASTSGDLNGDGLPDLITGDDFGTFRYYLNTGSASAPAFTEQTGAANPLNGQDIGSFATPALKDLTGDGLLDLVVGNQNGTFSYYKNTGSASTPAFTLQSGAANPLNGQDVGDFSAPALQDLNADGLADLIVANLNGTFSYYKNTGTASTPAFTLQTGAADPLSGQHSGNFSIPSLGDLDGDGLADLVVGNGGGTFSYYKNTGTANIPVFTLQTGPANPLGGQDVGIFSTTNLVDLDNDGHLDLIAGNDAGNFFYFRSQLQTAPVLNPTIHPQINIAEDISSLNGGVSLSAIIGFYFGADGWYDVDTGDPKGIAIIAADTTLGNWQYSTDNGTNWNSIGSPTPSSAFLLASDANARIRFVPNPNANGTIPDGLTFVAWDQTTGTNLGTVNASVRGGATAFSRASATINLTVTPVNDSPVLNNAGNPTLPTIPEDPTTNTGILVSGLIASMAPSGGITDPDAGALQGIAITQEDGSQGTWQYSLNNGSSWTVFPAGLSDSFALLLPSDANTRIRFIPALNYNGSANINFRAWDQTSGTAATTADASITGETSAFSTATESAFITITAVNDAPVLNNAGSPTLTSILPDTPDASNPGTSIIQIIANLTGTGGSITDVDSLPLQGIAVSSVDNSHGTWQYTTNNGTTWTDFGTPSGTSARLLAAIAATKMRFKPAAGYVGTATFLFVAWDQTAGTNGGTANIVSRGGTKPFSLGTDTGSLTVNNSPELTSTGNPTLTAIPKNVADASNTGTTVTQIIASLNSSGGSYTDANPGSLQGIAITSVDQSHGTWQFTTNNGTTWTDFGSTSATNARLLIATASTKIRFVPAVDYVGNATFVFVGWDVSVGINGGTAIATARGGARPFSLGYDTATINVFVPNAAPVLNAAGNPTLTSIAKNIPDATNTGTLVSQIIANLTSTGGSITDGDPGALQGIAITSAVQTNGTWQYSINNGTTWLNFGTPAVATARLLASDANTRIRFKPNAGYSGSATFLFVAWDQSTGVNGSTLSASKRGGLTPFSLNTDTATITVTP